MGQSELTAMSLPLTVVGCVGAPWTAQGNFFHHKISLESGGPVAFGAVCGGVGCNGLESLESGGPVAFGTVCGVVGGNGLESLESGGPVAFGTVCGAVGGNGSLAEMGVGWGELVFKSGETPGRPGGAG